MTRFPSVELIRMVEMSLPYFAYRQEVQLPVVGLAKARWTSPTQNPACQTFASSAGKPQETLAALFWHPSVTVSMRA